MFTVVFDLDDTLYDRSAPLKQAFMEHGLAKPIRFEQFHKNFKLNSDLAFNYVKEKQMTLEESHIFRALETYKQVEVKISKAQARDFQDLYHEKQQQIQLFPRITEILKFLQKQSVQVLIITNGPVIYQRKKIKNLGLEEHFSPDEIIVSGEEGISKPDPEIFRIAEQRFTIDRENTWYIGDSYIHDIIGAANIGWKSIWFNLNKEVKEENIATKTVTSTKELLELCIDLFMTTSNRFSHK